MLNQSPVAGANIVQLSQVIVFFDEPVQGVDAGDLLVNGVPATNLVFVSETEFRFGFTRPPNGVVTISWAPGNGITDLATPANAFAGGSWTYNLDPSLAVNSVRINEFLTGNTVGIRDEEIGRAHV